VRVLILAQFYPPDIGGEERHARNLALALASRGHEVSVVTSHLPHSPVGVSTEDGITVNRVVTTAQRIPGLHGDGARPHALPIADPAMRRAIDATLGARRFDVVHAHNWIVNSAIPAARAHGVPVVLTLHDYSHVCATKRFMRLESPCAGPSLARCVPCAARHFGAVTGPVIAAANGVERLVRERTVAAFVAVSHSVARRNALDRGGLDVEVIPNFIPDDLVLASATPAPDGPFLFVGDQTRDKGAAVLVEAYRHLRGQPPLHLVGRAVPELTIDPPSGVTISPPCPHDEIVTLMRQAHTVVVPSIVPDSCPTVVLEAMAAGRPVIASTAGGIVDMVVDGVTGILVAPGDAPALTQALQRLIDEPRLAARMGAAGLDRARLFTSTSVVERLEAVYVRAVERSRPSSRTISPIREHAFPSIEDARSGAQGVS
jgi:glycogen(starch) synthase